METENARTHQRPLSQIVLIIFATLGALLGLAILYFYRYLFLAGLIGLGLGVLINPIVNFLKRKARIPRGVGVLAAVLMLLLGSVSMLYGLYVLAAGQIDLFVQRSPQIVASIQTSMQQLFAEYPWIEEQVSKFEFGRSARSAFGTLFQGLTVGAAVIGGFFLVLTLAAYFAARPDHYLRAFLSLFPAYLRPRIATVGTQAARTLRQWFMSQLLVMTISGTATAIGLWIAGVDYWLLLGALTLAFGFIPYIGSILTGIAAVLVAFGSQPDKVLWVLAIYVAIQQLEGDVTIPLVMKGRAQLPEVHLIFFMLLMGSGFGILGVFVAPPLLAVGRSIYLMTYAPRMNARTAGPKETEIPSRKAAA